jgi:hypothetical protein
MSQFIDDCLNCGNKLPNPPKVFQGVLICDGCFKIVSHCVQRTKQELNMLFTVYADMLRVALVKGELRPPPPAPAGKTMPPAELTRAFKRMAQKFGGLHDGAPEERPDGEGGVRTLPPAEADPSDADLRGR